MSTGTKLFYTLGKINFTPTMKISTTPSISKYQKSFKTCMTATNPLIDGPDFTYLDGRPTPLNIQQRKRAIAQKNAIEKAFTMVEQIDYAVKRSQEKAKLETAEREHIIKSKFKEKGTPLE